MPFDGIFTKTMAQELNALLSGGRIGKIYQMDKDSIVLQIRANGENYRLLVSSNAAAARIHLTDKQYENPDTPPVFCMLLRKHLSGGIVKGFSTNGFERILTMEAEVTDELGDRSNKKLVVEIMGRHSNILLLNRSDKIIDVIKHVDVEVNRVRELLPARTYILPPAQDKLNPASGQALELIMAEAPSNGRKIESFLLDRLQGFSPVLCREACIRAGLREGIPASELTHAELSKLAKVLKDMMASLHEPSPCVVFDKSSEKVIDFHCVPLKQYDSFKRYDLLSQAIDAYYTAKVGREFVNQRANELHKLVGKQLERCEKRLSINLQTYEENKDFEKLRLFGELITANIYALTKGMEEAEVVNYYSEEGDMVRIPLNKDKSPQDNAQNYFKRYNKSRTAFHYAEKEVETLKAEVSYLESVQFAIENAEGNDQLTEIRTELHEQGYIKASGKGKKIQPVQALPLKAVSQDGFEILIGRNNKQNEKLTLKIARHEDIWLHIKNFSGSHVVIRTEGKEVPDSTLLEAAQYAAWFSKARSAPKVEVDYTTIRNVKKPSGSKPGMVIYVNYFTVLVAPKAPLVAEAKAQRN
ncbi:MAG: NFACT family protein [Clostridia bacterium]|nr:NFACT family protein [Clostridia bacterium]